MRTRGRKTYDLIGGKCFLKYQKQINLARTLKIESKLQVMKSELSLRNTLGKRF